MKNIKITHTECIKNVKNNKYKRKMKRFGKGGRSWG